MRSLFVATGVVLTTAMMTCSSNALEYKPVFGETPFLVVSGDFRVNEPLSEFASAVTASGATSVTFDSPGGNIASAMQLGRMIRAAGLDTFQTRQGECASACSLAFMGGVRRLAEPGSIGVHQSSFAPDHQLSTDEAVAGVQAVTAEIMSYLTDMGVDAKLLAVAMNYDKSDMRYLSASEMAALHVTNVDGRQSPVDTSQIQQPQHSGPPQDQASAHNQELDTAAADFVRALIEKHSTDELAIAQVLASYAGIVDYYGKPRDLSFIVADKRSYFQRWPERAYSVRKNSVMVTCANARCMVTGIYDWIVRSLPRNKQAKGAARFSYTIAIGPDPKVIAEAGQVLR
ncbi:hypothetical protein [Mesorhizobium sp. B2-6-2]|uniref:COG3904 family protein n=1 Tax=Mesorhizobium sp. B2-6-2 TaxID=2589915 RepID=UPI00112B3835|nr:hypothetical protein [Mesorhizobium sp. B2-6-2]TPJ72462.1 hypothetical protein FJ419_28105 [Mesorhizobium sp. B2-6-2]